MQAGRDGKICFVLVAHLHPGLCPDQNKGPCTEHCIDQPNQIPFLQDMRNDVYYLRAFLRDSSGAMIPAAEHMVSFYIEGTSTDNGRDAL